jgi:hypothetical protein
VKRLIGFLVAAAACFLGGYFVALRQEGGEERPPAAVQARGVDTASFDSLAEADTTASPPAVTYSSPLVIAGGMSPRLPRTLLDTASVNVDGDSTAERVELYADVAREAGRLQWDDGQRWLLVVRKGEETFTLLDEFVQLGTVGFTAIEHASGDQGAIVVETRAGSGVRVQSFVFDRAAGGFVSRDSVKADGIVVHRPRTGAY